MISHTTLKLQKPSNFKKNGVHNKNIIEIDTKNLENKTSFKYIYGSAKKQINRIQTPNEKKISSINTEIEPTQNIKIKNVKSPSEKYRKIEKFESDGYKFKKLLDDYEKKAAEVLEKTTIKAPLSKDNKRDQKDKKKERPMSEFRLKGNNLQLKKNIENIKTNDDLENNKIKEKEKLRPFSSYREEILDNNPISYTVEEEQSDKHSLFRKKIADYVIGKELGKGAYAIVKQAIHKPTNMKVAIKIFDKFKLLDPVKKTIVKKEIEILKVLNHPNIVKLYEVIDTPKQILIIMEYINGVSLLNYLKSKPNRKIDEEVVKNIFIQIISGIQYIHSKNISHGDIKLENLLIDSSNTIKIIDFGFGTHNCNGKLLNFFCGTPSYMPPEIVNRKNYQGSCADIWSVGVLLYTLICGSFPFRALSEKELYNKITKGVYIFPEYVSLEAKTLIQKILIINPQNRLKADMIMNDEWLKQLLISE